MQGQRQFLNVGGGSKSIPVPRRYEGWRHVMLDIDPKGKPDILADARRLAMLDRSQFDAVYCAHNLEHYFEHDVTRVLSGFVHVLKSTGFAEIRVPDIQQVMLAVAERGLDIEDALYESRAGSIRVRDVIYGFAHEIARSGKDFYAHKTGFSPKSLTKALKSAGFASVVSLEATPFEIAVAAFRSKPDSDALAVLNPTQDTGP